MVNAADSMAKSFDGLAVHQFMQLVPGESVATMQSFQESVHSTAVTFNKEMLKTDRTYLKETARNWIAYFEAVKDYIDRFNNAKNRFVVDKYKAESKKPEVEDESRVLKKQNKNVYIISIANLRQIKQLSLRSYTMSLKIVFGMRLNILMTITSKRSYTGLKDTPESRSKSTEKQPVCG